MGFDAIKNKISEVLGNEEQTDSALDAAADFANDKTGGQYGDQIQQGRDLADGKIGEENA